MANQQRSRHRNISITELGYKLLEALDQRKLSLRESPPAKSNGTPNRVLPQRLRK